MIYYLLPAVLSLLCFFNMSKTLSNDLNNKFKNFDFKNSSALRNDSDLETYLLSEENYDLSKDFNYKCFPPRSDYINKTLPNISSICAFKNEITSLENICE